MNFVKFIIANINVEQARGRAVYASKCITNHTVKLIPALWTKVYPTPEPVRKTAWESFMAKAQEPVSLPTYLFYLVLFVMTFDILFAAWNIWDVYGTTMAKRLWQCKLAEGWLSRCNSILIAVGDAFTVVWRPAVNTAIKLASEGRVSMDELRYSIQAGSPKIRLNDLKPGVSEMDVDQGLGPNFKLSLMAR